jgi:protein-S-isoprenylcysteine O-methyltransferase Ste14
MSKHSQYQQGRLILTKVFFAVIIALLVLSGSKLETEHEMICAVLFLMGCFLVGIASLGRLWCSLYIAGHKTKDLVTEGPYSICRNPLYFFSMLGGIGVGLASETLTIPAIILIAFALYYPYVIRFEENKLKEVHGQDYETYFQRVPRFWPKWSLLAEPQEYSVNPKTFRKHIFSALWFVWIVGVLEMLEAFREMNMFPTFFSVY